MGARGRKKGSDGERSRKLMLQIAAEEFAQNGFYHTKVGTIVSRAGVSQPAFYLYFSSKEAIYQELIDQFNIKLEELVGNSRLDSDIEPSSLSERIEVGLRAIFTFFEKNQYITKIAFIHSDQAYKIKEGLTAKIEGNLRVEQEYGYFRADIDLSIAAEIVISSIERLTITQLWTGKSTAEDITKDMVQIILNGIVKK
ncbi:TetR/AcrR family transcriptional regulator [Gracilibacillus oryzae]|uniref:TetR/AcrR family transcriptional regulator n=1 Tax=Gracilibacillus oryzae TaxID=1672701 RepID=UPI0018860513|nr:TetR/AcrR family transcriptional regulator [Gracilibacillus oryzae]